MTVLETMSRLNDFLSPLETHINFQIGLECEEVTISASDVFSLIKLARGVDRKTVDEISMGVGNIVMNADEVMTLINLSRKAKRSIINEVMHSD